MKWVFVFLFCSGVALAQVGFSPAERSVISSIDGTFVIPGTLPREALSFHVVTQEQDPIFSASFWSRVTETDYQVILGRISNLESFSQVLNNKLAQLSNRVESINLQVTQLSNRVESISLQVSQLSNRVETINSQVIQLSNTVQYLSSQVVNLSSQIVSLSSQVSNVLSGTWLSNAVIGVYWGIP